MKKIFLNNAESNYNFFLIEPNEMENVNIAGILAIPNGELKTKKLLTMLEEDKYKSQIIDSKTGERRKALSFEDSAKRVLSQGNIQDTFGFDGQVILMPMLPNDERISETLEDKNYKFNAEFLSRECFTEILKDNPYHRLDEQISKMIEFVIDKNGLEGKSNIFGHSTNGLSAMRFSMLQPQMVDNLIIGGNADEIPTPFGENATKLEYPFGTKDYKALFGKTFDLNYYRDIHFRYYIGEYEFIDPNLDGIRDANYGIKQDGRMGSGNDFAPKDIADTYKQIYNKNYRKDSSMSAYERLEYVLKQYELNRMDMKFKIYEKDCHSLIHKSDLKDAQFNNGEEFLRNGSELISEVMKKVQLLEKFAKNNPSNSVSKRYQAMSEKIWQNKESGDREKRLQALINIENEMLKTKGKNGYEDCLDNGELRTSLINSATTTVKEEVFSKTNAQNIKQVQR